MDVVVFHDDFTGFSGAQNGDLTKSNEIGTLFHMETRYQVDEAKSCRILLHLSFFVHVWGW